MFYNILAKKELLYFYYLLINEGCVQMWWNSLFSTVYKGSGVTKVKFCCVTKNSIQTLTPSLVNCINCFDKLNVYDSQRESSSIIHY